MTTSPARAADMRATLRQAAKMGRGGDDRIVHVNSYEEAVLRALGGAGTIHPETGLREYKYGGNVSEGGKTQGAKDAGGQGPNAGGRGGSSGSAAEYGASKLSGWKKDPATGGWSNPGFDKQAGIKRGGEAGQTGAGGQTYVGNDTTATQKRATQAGVSPDEYNREVTDYAGRVRDSLDTDNTGIENLGNLFARALGFNEQTSEEIDFDPENPVGPRASWGWDPVPGLVGLGGFLGGVPFGPGLIADQISAAAGRPLSVSLGPDVFGSDNFDESGQVIGSSRTHTGGSMTVSDPDRPNEFFGVSPEIGILGNATANTSPRKQTLYGTDPAAPAPGPIPEQPAPELPEGVGAPQPIEAANVSVDPGNSQLTESQLTNLFLGHLAPRSYRGRNKQTVIV